jgi:prepilin-type N-terminal cleavage/methylation domain-containing protein
MKQTNKKGFTLVELSIVLVIIGLLIGGILVGQSLIESAKMQSFIRQIGQYDAAVAVFQDKFGNLPGDNALFGAGEGSVAGTDLANGYIGDCASVIATQNCEIGTFWSDLSSSGLKNEEGNAGVWTAINAASGTTAPALNTNYPSAKIGTNVGIIAYGSSVGINGAGNFYSVGTITTASANIARNGGLKPADVVAIDSKLDDGAVTTGNIRAVDSSITALPVAATSLVNGTLSASTCHATSGTTLNAALTTTVCSIVIRMGLSTGVLN